MPRRTYAEERDIVLSAFDCFLNGEKGIYASSELTTGRRLYELMQEHGCPTRTELREKLGAERYRRMLFDRNAERASVFARELRHTLREEAPVVTPGPLVAPAWEQPHYHELWETLISTRVSVAYFNDGWAYSNGCTREFAAALESGVPTFDARSDELTLERGIDLVQAALRTVREAEMEPVKLEENLERLRRLRSGEAHELGKKSESPNR